MIYSLLPPLLDLLPSVVSRQGKDLGEKLAIQLLNLANTNLEKRKP